jgi:hypothetical protein
LWVTSKRKDSNFTRTSEILRMGDTGRVSHMRAALRGVYLLLCASAGVSLCVASDMKDYDAANRVYDRLLSVVEPGVIVETVLPFALGKRKTGAEDAPCAMEILNELSSDMQDAVDKQDSTACSRIYDRFLAERKNGEVSRFFQAHAEDTTPPPPAQVATWTRPHPHPSSRF